MNRTGVEGKWGYGSSVSCGLLTVQYHLQLEMCGSDQHP